MHLISTEDIQYQPLIGIRELCILEEDDVFSCTQHNGDLYQITEQRLPYERAQERYGVRPGTLYLLL